MSGLPAVLPFNRSQLIKRFGAELKLSRFYDLLMVENARVNLVSRETSRSSFDRMAAECLLPLTVLPQPVGICSYLDIGAGGGFPLIPIALSGAAQSLHACERTQKKAAALARIARDLDLHLTVIPRTFEDIHFEQRFDFITLRFVKLTKPLLAGIASVLSEHGVIVYYSEPSFAIDRLTVQRFRFQTSPDQPFKHFCLIARK